MTLRSAARVVTERAPLGRTTSAAGTCPVPDSARRRAVAGEICALARSGLASHDPAAIDADDAFGHSSPQIRGREQHQRQSGLERLCGRGEKLTFIAVDASWNVPEIFHAELNHNTFSSLWSASTGMTSMTWCRPGRNRTRCRRDPCTSLVIMHGPRFAERPCLSVSGEKCLQYAELSDYNYAEMLGARALTTTGAWAEYSTIENQQLWL